MTKRKNPKDYLKTGRPSTYTKELGQEICLRISNGELLTKIVLEDGMPAFSTVYDWADAHPEFSSALSRAKRIQAFHHADFIAIRALDESRDYYTDSKGERRSDNTSVLRDRLVSENFKHLMRCQNREAFGDKSETEISGPNQTPLVPVLNIKIDK